MQDPVLDATVRELKKAFPKVQLRKVRAVHRTFKATCTRVAPQLCMLYALDRRYCAGHNANGTP